MHQRSGSPAKEVKKKKRRKKNPNLYTSSCALPLGSLALRLGTRPVGETGDGDAEMKGRPDWFIL